jgi:DNA topoisomerase I
LRQALVFGTGELKMEKVQIPGSLVYVNDSMEGFSRKGENPDFIYVDKEGNEVTDEKVLERIAGLVIPPDWRDVWICRKILGHIQATGRDSKGRKQYIYHRRWGEHLSRRKYDNLKEFGEKLPLIREQVNADLRKRNWDKKKMSALAVKLMGEGYLRVGNKMYQKMNGTIGLTTLRRKHLKKEANNLILQFKAKSGKEMKVKISHPTLKKQLKQCSELPGHELFRYKDENGYMPLTSTDINEYLREVSGINISSKDFRTWGGTVLTVKFEEIARQLCIENPRKKLETTLVQLVAKELNNTVSVCRKYYIHPKVLTTVVKGKTSNYLPDENDEKNQLYSRAELTVMNIISE